MDNNELGIDGDAGGHGDEESKDVDVRAAVHEVVCDAVHAGEGDGEGIERRCDWCTDEVDKQQPNDHRGDNRNGNNRPNRRDKAGKYRHYTGKTSSPIWEMIIQGESPGMTKPSAVAVPPSDSEWNHVRDTIYQGFIQRLAKAQARGVSIAILAWRCRLIVKRSHERFLDKFFGLFDSGINTGGNEALANEPFLIVAVSAPMRIASTLARSSDVALPYTQV